MGVLIGSSFSPDFARAVPQWLFAICALAIHVSLVGALCFTFFRRVARFDCVTAFFCSAPGGIMEMLTLAELHGGSTRAISLIQATRTLLIVATVPVYFRVRYHFHAPAPPASIIGSCAASDFAVLGVCAVAGFFCARALRFPTPALIGPMLLSIGVHITGISHVAPPPNLIACVQIVIGGTIGVAFVGARLAELSSIVIYGIGSTLIMIAMAIVTATFVAPLIGMRIEALVLSLVPGGLNEMTLVALTLGIETAFVSTMHVARITLVMFGAPFTFGLIARKRAQVPT
jgi:membrane AbrB-like protein